MGLSMQENQPAGSLAPGELVAGRYRIVRLIGRGGMGEVYEAYDQFLKEPIALKTLRVELVRKIGVLPRFQKEVQLARKVTHPSVCRVFETGLEDRGPVFPPLPFFTMELLAGETLAARIQRVQRLSRREAFPLAVQMAEGLQAAHAAGVVHADFKSANVILVPGARGERAVITDFGLARVDPATIPADQTRSVDAGAHLTGTVAYMSPEQMTGEIISVASDIYSFGIVLFEMATGRRPFDENHVIHSAVQRVSGGGITARSLVPNLDARWDAAIARCLQKEPERRFASAGDLAGWFREDGWRAPLRYRTRRDWIRAGIMAGVPIAAAGAYWKWTHLPYRPQPAALDWYRKGVAGLHSMTYEAARKAFQQAVAVDPGFALAQAGLARAYDELDYSDLAKESMLRAMTLAQDSRLSSQDELRLRSLEALVARDYDRARPLFQRLEDAAAPGEKAAAALENGWLEQQADNTQAAAAAYARALKLSPGYAAAKLRLGYILGRRRQVDAALAAFREAESLYRASSDYEGVTEAQLQQAMLLNRSSRSAEAAPIIRKALAVAGAVGNSYQKISLQLAEATAARYLGDTAQAGALAQQAIDAALAEKMDSLATSGLIDLGNSFVIAGDLASAEPVFRRALDIAGRAKVRRDEARARASLASLCEQDHRPDEAQQFVEAALRFYRQAGYRREFVQAMSLLGSIHEQKAEFEESAQVLREALAAAAQLDDSRTEALTRERLGEALRDQGDWPEALSQLEQAAGVLGSRASSSLLSRAELYGRLGRRDDAQRSWSQVEKLITAGSNLRLLLQLKVNQARFAYQDDRMQDALALSREASRIAAAAGGEAALEAHLLQALVSVRTHPGALTGDPPGGVVDEFDKAKLLLEAASARLDLANAMLARPGAGPAAMKMVRRFTSEALDFFEPRKIWEAAWRAHALAAEAAPDPAAAQAQKAAAGSALARMKQAWPRASFESYLRRPDIRRLSTGLNI